MSWTLETHAAVPIWRPRDEVAGAILAFSTRLGGVSAAPYDTLNLGRSTEDRPEAVAENRRRFLATLGLDSGGLATAGQVHGREVARVAAPGLHAACDVLVTREPGIALAVTCADCLPLLLVAPGAVAAAHSGWRGTVAGAPQAALGALCELAGVGPERVSAHVGPCIRSCCYQVGPEVARQFPDPALKRVNGFWHLDLAAAVRSQLLESGMAAEHLHDAGACTACEPARYFSHRRDQGRTGRQWAVAALRK